MSQRSIEYGLLTADNRELSATRDKKLRYLAWVRALRRLQVHGELPTLSPPHRHTVIGSLWHVMVQARKKEIVLTKLQTKLCELESQAAPKTRATSPIRRVRRTEGVDLRPNWIDVDAEEAAGAYYFDNRYFLNWSDMVAYISEQNAILSEEIHELEAVILREEQELVRVIVAHLQRVVPGTNHSRWAVDMAHRDLFGLVWWVYLENGLLSSEIECLEKRIREIECSMQVEPPTRGSSPTRKRTR